MNPLLLSAKLFISVLTMTDTGSVAQSAVATDIPTMQQCIQLKESMNYTKDEIFYGHKVTVRVKADCAPMQMPVASGLPPAVAGMLHGFMNGLDQ
jgi:hypothetical protein